MIQKCYVRLYVILVVHVRNKQGYIHVDNQYIFIWSQISYVVINLSRSNQYCFVS